MRLYCDLAGNPFLSIEKNLLSIQMASNFYHREILYIGVAGTSFQIRWDVLRHSHISIQTKTAVLSFQSFFCLYLIQLYTHISLNYLCVWNVLYKFTCPALMYTICSIVEIAFPCDFFHDFSFSCVPGQNTAYSHKSNSETLTVSLLSVFLQ